VQSVVAGEGVTQLPVPLHDFASTSVVELLHVVAAHTVADDQSAHAPPWHVPLVPHVRVAVVAHSPRGFIPLVAVLHVPFAMLFSAAEQAMQVAVHAVLQHTPSAQKPLWHWSTAVHAVPLVSLSTHAWAMQ
jgi:hypothetical protein